VQVNYLGYPGTMGAPYIDYIIADRHVIPPGHDNHFTEKIVRLPDAYQVNDATRRIAEARRRAPTRACRRAGFVFCCFNSNYKITPEIFAVWMRLLASRARERAVAPRRQPARFGKPARRGANDAASRRIVCFARRCPRTCISRAISSPISFSTRAR
jgi:hypothetical protein